MKKLVKKAAALISLTALVTASVPFSVSASPYDTAGHWAVGTINKWINMGYIKGYPDGSFKPDNSITRAELVVLVNKAFNFNSKSNIYFTDLSPSYWGYGEIQKGVAAGYIKGDSIGTFRPDSPVTRQEAAVIMAQVRNLGGNVSGASKYSDYYNIADWAKGYVGAASNEGVLSGFPDGSFKPSNVMTRAEAVTALNYLLNVPYGGSQQNKPPVDSNEDLENYTLEKTSLSGKVIKGDLIISKDLGSKTINLDDITVEGALYVYGGGTIYADDCDVNKLVIDKSSAEFKAEGNTTVKKTSFNSNGRISGKGYEDVLIDDEDISEVTIDASVDKVKLDADVKLKLNSDAFIKTLEATKNADNATVTFVKGAEVKDFDIYDKIKIKGKGDIDTMTVYVSGVESDIRPDTVKTKDGASKPKYTSSSDDDDDSSSGSSYKDLTIKNSNNDYDGNGRKYDDVKITASSGADISDFTVYGDLTIEKSVGTSSVTLTDIDVRGNIYIYGGQDHITFKNCNIRKDIISDTSDRDVKSRSAKNEFVKIRFDEDTKFAGRLRVKGNTSVEAYPSGKDITINGITVENALDRGLILRADVNTLTVNGNCIITLSSGKTINNFSTADGLTDVRVALEGGNSLVKNINTNSKLYLTGNGNVGNIITNDANNISKEVNVKVDNISSSFVSVTNVIVNPLEGTVGIPLKLTANVEPSNATNKAVAFNLKNAGTTAAVLNGDILSAANAGTVIITVEVANGLGQGIKYTKDIAINIKAKEPEIIEVTNINVSPLEGTAGEPLQLTGTVEPSNATNKTVTYEVKDAGTTGAIVSGSTLTTMASGTVTLTAKVEGGLKSGAYTKDVVINIKAKEPEIIEVTNINVSPLEGTAGEPLQLTGTVEPSNATNKTVTYEVKDAGTTGASVSGSTLTTTAAGTVTLTAKVEGGLKSGAYTKDIVINIKQPGFVNISNVNLLTEPAEKVAGVPLTLSASIEPENATNKGKVDFIIKNPGTTSAVLTGNVLTALSPGRVELTVTVENGLIDGNYQQDIAIDIAAPTYNIAVGQKFNLSTLIGEEEKSNNIVWSVKFAPSNSVSINNAAQELTANAVGTILINVQMTNKTDPSKVINKTYSFAVTS